ncbi:MAG TPA: VOC family protein [Anaerolinea sp.]|nr:VOC family protein [Anaerolinea sp.]
MEFRGICLVTPNVPGLAAFYQRVFACKAQGDVTHAEVALPGLGLAIFSWAGMEEMAPGSMRAAGTGCATLMFEVEDVDAEYERLAGLGVEVVKPPQTHPWGSRAAWFRDPDGNILDFYSRVAG